jgi:isopenicillin N synthase-like dioxygenase
MRRVRAQVALNAGRERLSTAFFLDADYDCVVDPADIPATCAPSFDRGCGHAIDVRKPFLCMLKLYVALTEVIRVRRL